MLFDNIKTEKDVEDFKRSIMRDKSLYEKIVKIRKNQSFSNDGTIVWKKVANSLKTGTKKLPTNAELLVLYKQLVEEGEQKQDNDIEQVLRKIKVRSNSGVAVVSVLTKPYACPGKCIYCPTEKGMPKSYLSKEPAAARALANNFDPYTQTQNRMKALVANGHPVDKLEMIVIGGTWSYYDHKYQDEFISEMFRAANNFFVAEEDEIQKGDKTLTELQLINETAGARIIGLSIETRPDYIDIEELNRLRYLGVTKVEIGVQHLNNEVLEYNKREMTREDIAEKTELLRSAGLKIVYHMMPNLPKSNIDMDIQMFKELYSGKDFHPDMVKMYPCVVLENSELYTIWEKGGFKPYTDEELVKVLSEAKKATPPYVRIIRVIRDIPATYIMAGSKVSNLRQVIEKDQKENNWSCKCIRCREVRNEKVSLDDYAFSKIEYETREGKEVFLSFENKERNKCAAFCRLRLPKNTATRDFYGDLEVLKGASIIRELHTYGQLIKIDEEGKQSQHRGLGLRLMEEAEKIAREAGYKKMAVISGVGVREYYKNKLGYKLDRTYMVKLL